MIEIQALIVELKEISMIDRELFNKLNWKDYLEDYHIKMNNNKNGIKIISKRKELDFDDILNLNDSSVKMFEFDFDLRYTSDLIQCLMNGISFEQQYGRNYRLNRIYYSYDPITKILNRKVNGMDKKIQLTDEYIVAICKFVLERQKEKVNRDVENSQSNVTKSFEELSEDIFNKYVKPSYLSTVEIGKQNDPYKTIRSYVEIYYEELKNFKGTMIKNILKGNNIKYSSELEQQLISKLNDLMKEEIKNLEEQEKTGDN